MKTAKLSMYMLVAIIIIVVALIIMLGFLNFFKDLGSEQVEKDACKASVYENYIMRLKGFNIVNSMKQTPIKCPANEVHIEEEVNEKNDETIKRIIGKEWVGCYEKFWKGELNLFDENQVYCVVCSTIDFNDKGKKVESLGTFLAEEIIPGKKVSYLSYIRGYEEKDAAITFENVTPEDIEAALDAMEWSTDKRYQVMMVYAKGKPMMKILGEAIKNSATGGAVAVGGAIMLAGGKLIASGAIAEATVIGIPVGLGAQAVGTVFVKVGAVTSLVGSLWAAAEAYIKTDPNAHSTLFVLREYTKPELDTFKCQYLPAVQSELKKS